MVTYITIIYIMHCTSEIQGRREAQPPGCTLHTLRSLSRRPQILPAGVRGFVARNPETETGGSNERARSERHDAHHGNKPRFRMHEQYCNMTHNLYDHDQHTRMQQDGALEGIVKESLGGPRMALEVAYTEGGIREDAEGLHAVLVTVWGVEEDKWDEQMAQDIMGEHVNVLRAEAIRNRSNEHKSCWMVVEPREGIHFDENLWCNSQGCVSKADSAIRRGDKRVVSPIWAEQTVSLYVLEEGQRGTMCQGGLGELQVVGERVHPRVGEKMQGARYYVVEFRGLDPRGTMVLGGGPHDGKWDKMVERLRFGGFESEYKEMWVDGEGYLIREWTEGCTPLVSILELGPVFGASLQDSHSPLMPSLTQQHDCMHHTVPQSPAQPDPNPNPKQDAPPTSNPNQPGTRHRGEEGSRLIKNIISPGRGEPLAKISQEGPSLGGNQPLGREAHKRDQRGVTSPLRGREGRSFPRETATKNTGARSILGNH